MILFIVERFFMQPLIPNNWSTVLNRAPAGVCDLSDRGATSGGGGEGGSRRRHAHPAHLGHRQLHALSRRQVIQSHQQESCATATTAAAAAAADPIAAHAAETAGGGHEGAGPRATGTFIRVHT